MGRFNGRDVPAIGVPGAAHAPRPTVSPAQARVLDRITAAPEIRGPVGRAWPCDLEAARARLPAAQRTQDAMVAHWVVEAPRAHPVWHSYSLILIHLRPVPGLEPPRMYEEGATHELHLYAINPGAQRERMLAGHLPPDCWLTPVNFAAQFRAASDQEAHARVIQAIGMMCLGRLSPDTDHQRGWVHLFGDSMLRHRETQKIISPGD